MSQGLYIDGVAASQAIDTAGEVVSIAGMDITSLVGSVFNYEHKSDLPAQIVGKILYAKKIFDETDCENDRQKKYWATCKIPFLYCMGQLFDDYSPSAQEIAGVFLYDQDNKDKPPTIGFSVEGSKIAKEGMIVTRSIARKISLTASPANKTCLAEAVQPDGSQPKDDLESIFKTEYSVDMLKAEEAATILGIPMNKSEDYKKGSILGTTTSGKDVFSHGKVHASGFDAGEHKEAAQMHFDAAGKQKGDPKMAQMHYDKYKLHNQAGNTLNDRKERQQPPVAPTSSKTDKLYDPGLSGKVQKAMTADSCNVAPGNKTQGAALAGAPKPKLTKAEPKFPKKTPKPTQEGDTEVFNYLPADHSGPSHSVSWQGQSGPKKAIHAHLAHAEKHSAILKQNGKSPEIHSPKMEKGMFPPNVEEHIPARELQQPKPKLTKDEKGVHLPAKGMDSEGTSNAGASLRSSNSKFHGVNPNSAKQTNSAKAQHKARLGELKAMPKPKLTKADMYRGAGERIPARDLQKPNLRTDMASAKNFKAGAPTKELAGTSQGQGEDVRAGDMGNAKDAAQRALNFERRMKKPKLTKAETLQRAEEAYKAWDKRSRFEKFMKERMPKLAKGEVIALGQAIALKKSLDGQSSVGKTESGKDVHKDGTSEHVPTLAELNEKK